MTQTAIVGATLIDGNGGEPIRDAVVLFEGDRFVAAGSREGSTLPENITQVDAAGKFLIPGIINANVHLLDGWTFMIGTGTVEYLARFEKAVRDHAEIQEWYLMTGSGDYVLRVQIDGIDAYGAFHRDVLSRLPGVSRIMSSFAMRSNRRM